MALLIIFITCISCVLLNFDFIEANSSILSNSRILCVEYAGVNEMIQVAPNDTIFRINQTNFEISYTVIPEVCIYSFVITQVEIEVISNKSSCDKDYIDIREYIITSKFRSLKKSLQLNSNQNKVQNLGTDIVSVTIEPTLADKLYIARNVTSNRCMKYRLLGHTTIRVTVLSYSMTRPMLRNGGSMLNRVRGSDETYTGLCNDMLCFGGKGTLMDGIIGNSFDDINSLLIVGWRCSPDMCIIKLGISLTGPANISELIFYGFRNRGIIPPPQATRLVLPDTGSVGINTDEESRTYRINLAINQEVDRMEVDFEVLADNNLVLSEVQVISQGVNLGPLNMEYTYTYSTLSNNEDYYNTVIHVSFSLTIVIGIILFLLLFVCCIYKTIKYRRIKKYLNLRKDIHKPRNESVYSVRPINHGSLYATISQYRNDLANRTLPIPDSGSKNPPLLQNNNSLEQPLILHSPENTHFSSNSRSLKDTRYIDSNSVSMGNQCTSSTHEYRMDNNILYGANQSIQPVTTVYGVIDTENEQFPDYDRIKHN